MRKPIPKRGIRTELSPIFDMLDADDRRRAFNRSLDDLNYKMSKLDPMSKEFASLENHYRNLLRKGTS